MPRPHILLSIFFTVGTQVLNSAFGMPITPICRIPHTGGQRSASCSLDFFVSYRDDTLNASSTRAVVLGSTDGKLKWSWTLRNGWAWDVSVGNVPAGISLSLKAEVSDGTQILVTTVTTPSATDCVVSIASPSIVVSNTSAGSGIAVFVGGATVVLSAATAGAVISYTLTGAQISTASTYIRPILLVQCGWTTITAYATRPGSVASTVATRNVSVTVSFV
jgi:hypothetical protein